MLLNSYNRYGFCHDKIQLKPDDPQQTLSDFEHKVLRWANKRLNEPKLLTWDVDFMVSEDFLNKFVSVYGSN